MAASPEQLHAALSYCIDFGRIMLEDSGEFLPFGARVDSNGEVMAVGGQIEGQERPRAQELYEFLLKAQRSELESGRAIATAVAVNVNIPDEYAPSHKDGLRITLDAVGYSRFIYVPYRLAKAGLFKSKWKVELGEQFSVELKAPS